MNRMEELLALPCVNTTEVIHELMDQIEILRGKVNNGLQMEKALREGHQNALQSMQRLHKEEIQKHMDQHVKNLNKLELMDSIAAEHTIMVKCRKCDCHYELPCDLSEFDPDMSYCGKGGPSPCLP